MTDSFHVNVQHTRDESQRAVYEEIRARNECPFCPDNLHRSHSNPIVREGEQWIVTPNQWPYEHTSLHLLAIMKYHAERPSEMKAGALDELQDHLQWAEEKYTIAAGALAMRFGDTAVNGASVSHLHAHIIQPDINKPEEARVRFKIS